jgi:hypothetical protein
LSLGTRNVIKSHVIPPLAGIHDGVAKGWRSYNIQFL